MVTFVNRAKVNTATTGSGTITLGSAVVGFQTFGDAGLTNGASVNYTIEDGVDFELGTGVYSSTGPTLTRTLVQSSTGSLLNLTGGAVVFVTALASDLAQITTAAITGGTINGTTIGATTASTGSFTTLTLGGTAITSTAAELNILDGVTATAAELNQLDTNAFTSSISIPTTTTQDRSINIGQGRTGNGNSFIDLVGDATYTTYGMRFIRTAGGANSDSNINHRGTGALRLIADDAGRVVLETNNLDRLTVDSSGKVNIGGATQRGKITVTSTGSVGTNWATDNAITATGTSFGGGIAIIDGSAGYQIFATGSGANLIIRGAAVGTALGGGVQLTNYATSWTSASDERIKTIIEPIENAVDKVKQLRTVIGRYNDQDETHRHPFLIAQDVQVVLPEAVSVLDDGSGTDYLGISYTDVIPLLTAALKELSAKNDALEARIAALESK